MASRFVCLILLAMIAFGAAESNKKASIWDKIMSYWKSNDDTPSNQAGQDQISYPQNIFVGDPKQDNEIKIREERGAKKHRTKRTTESTTTTEQTTTTEETTTAGETTTTEETTTTATEVSTTRDPYCPWGEWEKWSRCDCRTGTQTRIRNPLHVPGMRCSRGSHKSCEKGCTIKGCAGESRACTNRKCPIDCVYSKWSSWSECNGPCGDSIRRRYRRVRVPALYGGKKCKRFMEEETCPNFDPICAPQDCDVSEWSAWSECELTNPFNRCGECIFGNEYANSFAGVQIRERIVIDQGGGHCPHLQETNPCSLTCC